jgi:predicted RNase H-like HicB family nuclease
MPCYSEGSRDQIEEEVSLMIDLKYSLVIEATADPVFFGFYSPDLEGFTGVGHSIEDCIYKARWGMEEHIQVLAEQNLCVPDPNPNPRVIIQNEDRLAPAA